MFKFDDSIKRLSKESLGHVGEEGLVWVRSYDLSRASVAALLFSLACLSPLMKRLLDGDFVESILKQE